MLGMLMPQPLNLRRTRESIPFGRLHDSCVSSQHGVHYKNLAQQGTRPPLPHASQITTVCDSIAGISPAPSTHRHRHVRVRLVADELALVLVQDLHFLEGLHHLGSLQVSSNGSAVSGSRGHGCSRLHCNEVLPSVLFAHSSATAPGEPSTCGFSVHCVSWQAATATRTPVSSPPHLCVCPLTCWRPKKV